MGLLDFLETPQGQAIASGMATYAATARRGTPWNNLGRGALGGVTGYNNALEAQQAAQKQAQLQEYNRKQQELLGIHYNNELMRTQNERARLDAQAGQRKAEKESALRMMKAIYPGLGGYDVQDDGVDWNIMPVASADTPMPSMSESGGQIAPVANDKTGRLVQSPDGQIGIDFGQYNRGNAKMFGLSDEDMQNIAQIGAVDPKLAMRMMNDAFKAKLRGSGKSQELKPTGDLANFMLLKQSGQIPEGTDYTDWHRKNAASGAAQMNNYGTSLVPAFDASGNPVFLQPSKGGGVLPIKDYTPPKLESEISKVETAKAGATGMLSVLDKALAHPGLKPGTGISSVVDPRNYIKGTDAYNFRVVIDQIKGKTFLEAYNSLRGGGQITEAEGKKATDAMARLDTGQSEEEFRSALQDLRDVVSKGMERLDNRFGRKQGEQAPKPAAAPAQQPKLMRGQVMDGYRYKGGDPADKANWEKVK